MTESRYFHIFIIRIIKYSTITIFQNEHHNIKNIESLTPKIVIWNFYSLNSIRHTVDNHRATILKINIELKIHVSHHNTISKLPAKIPFVPCPLAAILFTYSYIVTDQQFRKPNTKSTNLVHHSVHGTGLKPSENNAFPCRSTRGYWYLLSLKKRSWKRETSILNLAAGGRRMESPFHSSPSPLRLLLSFSFSPPFGACPRSLFHVSSILGVAHPWHGFSSPLSSPSQPYAFASSRSAGAFFASVLVAPPRR